MRAVYGILPLILAVSACTGNTIPQFDAAADGDNQLSFHHEKSTTIIDVLSPRGIGRADITLAGGNYPGRIILRLHLTGLEGFRLVYGDTILGISASGTPAIISQNLLEPGGHEKALTSASPLWMDVHSAGDYFEVNLPGTMMREKPAAFSFEWVDYYR